MPYPQFDRSRLRLLPLGERVHDMSLADVLPLDAVVPDLALPELEAVAERVARARQAGREVILMMGAHVIKVGLSRFIVDLVERGLVTHLGMNGACAIHDYELALVGATTESVARYIRDGQFGLWEETGRLNDMARQAAGDGIGFGEAVGRAIAEGNLPHGDVSILAAAHRCQVPATLHVGIGYDIIHEHPNADGAAIGAAGYADFLVIAETITRLEGGVLLNFGTAVMGPEVYLKALAMARNVAAQEGREIRHFTTAVFDVLDLGGKHTEAPDRSDPQYYYRPWKTILVRTVADGGESFFICADHRAAIPNLHRRLTGMAP